MEDCEESVRLFRKLYAPTLEQLEIDLSIECRSCPEDAGYAAFFDPSQRQIVLCANTTDAESHEVLLKHELIHATDVLIGKLDSNDDDDLACMEIRAHRWAQCETSWMSTSCTKRHAIRSIRLHFDNDEDPAQLVERNFSQCVKSNLKQ